MAAHPGPQSSGGLLVSRRLRLDAGRPVWTKFEVAIPRDKSEAEIAELAAHSGQTTDAVKAEITRMRSGSIVAKNSIYQVMMFRVDAEGLPGGFVLHLSIRRNDRRRPGAERWRDFQRIKNELCGPETEGVELYPAESRLVDAADQYHLWVLPLGVKFPFGFSQRDVDYRPAPGGGRQTPPATA